MKEHKGANAFHSKQPTVITIGTFDGVHAGHRKIIERLVTTAAESNLDSAILTFFPHPRMVLQTESELKLIHTIEERKQILEQTGLDHLIIHPFTHAFSRLSAREFVRDILVNSLKAKKVIIGYDHRFGRNRTADIDTLREFGKEYEFEVEEITRQEVEDVAVSSTKIRNALLEGKVEKANRYLQHPFMLTGIIVRGKGLGKGFGYPTANLQIEEDYKLIPANGVYVVRADIDDITYYGMMSIGTNPTVGGKKRSIETHFFLLNRDLYGTRLQIEMLVRIRDEKNFETVEALKLAMKQDEAFSIQYVRDNYAE